MVSGQLLTRAPLTVALPFGQIDSETSKPESSSPMDSGMVVFLRDVAFIWLPRDRIDDHGLFNHHFYSVSKKAVQSMNVQYSTPNLSYSTSWEIYVGINCNIYTETHVHKYYVYH